LIVFSRNVQRKVFAVDHTLYKAEIARKELLALGLDENFTRVQMDVAAFSLHAKALTM
jgi:tRNA A58 N-methylase Trm61